MQSLPNEILDRILDYLHNDRRTLAACALASRVLLQTSRFHRFNSHSLIPTDALKLAPLLVASPMLGASIVSLQFTPSISGFPNDAETSMLLHLSALRELDTYLSAIPAVASLMSATSTLTVLRVRGSGSKLPQSSFVIKVLGGIAMFTSLDKLELLEVNLLSEEYPELQLPPPPPRLRKVCIEGGNSADTITQWIEPVTLQPLYSVRHSIMAMRNTLDFMVLSETLASLAQELEVNFIPDGSMTDCLGRTHFSLAPYAGIRTCVLRFAFSEMCVRENRSLAWIPTIVAQLSSSCLRSLTISLVVDNMEDLRSLSSECAVRALSTAYFDDMRVLDWTILGQALSTERLPVLEQVVLEGRGSRRALEDYFKDICPELHSRGVLSLVAVENAPWLF